MHGNDSDNDIEALSDLAEFEGCTLPQFLARRQNPQIKKESNWPNIITIDKEVEKVSIDLLNNTRSSIMTKWSVNVADSVLFPQSSVFLHGLGVLASALTRNFYIDYGYEKIPVNLYVVVAQPPSTGKSGVNNRFINPILKAYRELNLSTKTERRRLKAKVARKLAELDALYKKDYQEHEEMELSDELQDAEERLAKIPEWVPLFTDTTIEAAGKIGGLQNGMFNIISAEASAVKVVTGAVYGDGKTGGNNGLLLQAWDGEYASIARVGRDSYAGVIRATISVLSQDLSVDAILEAGSKGDGLAERFLLVNEKTLLGERGKMRRKPINISFMEQYEKLITNIVNEPEDVLLVLSEDANRFVNKITNTIENEMGDSGIYSNDLLTGYMGKADKHIKKIAAVLHCSIEWAEDGSKSRTISQDTVAWATYIFKQLAKTYINAADIHGYTGKSSEIEKIKSMIVAYAEKGKLKVSIDSIRSNIKKIKPFRGSRNLTLKLRDEILPILEQHNYIAVGGSEIYINPKLK